MKRFIGVLVVTAAAVVATAGLGTIRAQSNAATPASS